MDIKNQGRRNSVSSVITFGKIGKSRRLSTVKVKRPRVEKLLSQEQNFEIRNEIVDDGRIRCPAFSVPLIAYDSDGDSDQEDYGDLEMFPTIVKAKKTWKKLYKIIMDKRTDIPLKQMAIKAKHEDLIFKKILANFSRGKSITEEREKLANLNEHMKFKGGPKDNLYKRKVLQ